jgi:predicted Zn-dependent protease
MTLLMRKALVLIFFLLLTACTTVPETTTLAPGERPEKASIEAGLWMQIENIEKETKRSGRLVKDQKLNAYVKRIVCNLAGEYCSDIRVYILDVNLFNAAMYPNGMMHIYTGLLLRTQSEAQLASVLGHEITHYVKKHSLKRFVDIQTKADALAVLGVPLGAVGLGPVTPLLSLAAMGSIAAYSRDHEREADSRGLDLLAKLGYSPGSASEVWENLTKEHEVEKDGATVLFFASHPQSEERIKNLRKHAKEIPFKGTPKIGEKDHLEAIAEMRGQWFQQELLRRKFKQSELVLQNLSSSKWYPGELHFFRGELIRKQAEEDYVSRSIEYYQKAIEMDDSDPRPRRAIGLMLMKTDQKVRAAENLEMYLKLKPNADDTSIIKNFLTSLR